MMMDEEKLLKLHAELQNLSAKVLNTNLSEAQRDECRKKTVEIANQISIFAQKGEGPVYIINLNRRTFRCNRSYGAFQIAGRAIDKPFAFTVIPPVLARGFSKDAAWERKRFYSGREIAEDLCKEINGDLPFFQVAGPFRNLDNSQGPRIRMTLGCFICDISAPSKKQLEDEIEALVTYYRGLFDEARSIFAKTRDRKLLADLHFEAAEYLIEHGISDEEEWCSGYSQMNTCPGCVKPISPKAAVCTCGWILNADAFRKQQELRAQLAK
jgi:hypothetical protein